MSWFTKVLGIDARNNAREASMKAAKEQIDYYQKAKDELKKQAAANEEQKKTERLKINQNELKARQRQYKRSGFMQEPAAAPQEKLG